MTMPTLRPLPLLTPLNATFWTAGRDGHLCLARCSDCGAWLHPPGPICPECLGQHLSPQPMSGFGVIETFTVNHQAWSPDTVVPYVIAIVSLAESPHVRLTTNIVGVAPENVRIGTRVRVLFEQHEDVWVPLFTPA